MIASTFEKLKILLMDEALYKTSIHNSSDKISNEKYPISR